MGVILEQHRAVEEALDHWSGCEPGVTKYEIINSGESSWAVYYSGADDGVLKISRSNIDGPSLLRFEAGILERLEVHGQAAPAPLQIPNYLDLYDSWRPCYLVMSRLPGQFLDLAQAEVLNDFEHANMGAAIGKFVAWMAQAVTYPEYEKIVSESALRESSRHNREYWLRRYMGGAGIRWLTEQDCAQLDTELEDNYITYRELLVADRLQPTIIGHDDLGWHNISLEHDGSGSLQPVGVLDFETVRPSSPERELRYMWLLSEAAGTAACEAYESAAGASLDIPLVEFWAQAQCLTNTVNSVSQPEPCNSMAELMARKRQLERLFPGRDWSELERIEWDKPDRDCPEVYSCDTLPAHFCREV